MAYVITSIVITILLYSCIGYMSFFVASTLHSGITYGLSLTVLKSVVFILLCYTSIISDVVLFRLRMYDRITQKNGFLLLLVAASLIYAKDGKDIGDEHSRE